MIVEMKQEGFLHMWLGAFMRTVAAWALSELTKTPESKPGQGGC